MSTTPRLRAVGRVLREVIALEIAIYRCLARWILRRPDVPADAEPVRYDRLSGPMLWLWIFGSATEVVVFEVVLRSIDAAWAETIRLPLLVIGIWGVLWMLGMLASYRIRPHLLFADRLRIRSGPRTWVEVPLAAVVTARPVEGELPGLVRTLHTERAVEGLAEGGGQGDLLLVGVGSRTNLELTLTAPTALAGSAPGLAASRVGLWVDDPREVAHAITHRGAGMKTDRGPFRRS